LTELQVISNQVQAISDSISRQLWVKAQVISESNSSQLRVNSKSISS